MLAKTGNSASHYEIYVKRFCYSWSKHIQRTRWFWLIVTRPGHSFLQFQIKYTPQMTLDESNLPSYVCLSLHKRTTMEIKFKKSVIIECNYISQMTTLFLHPVKTTLRKFHWCCSSSLMLLSLLLSLFLVTTVHSHSVGSVSCDCADPRIQT